VAAALALGMAGCQPPVESRPVAKPVIVVPRAAVPNIYTYYGSTGYALARVYPGEIAAVVGYGFDPVPGNNGVTLGPSGAGVPCAVVGGRAIDRDETLGLLSALFFWVPDGVAPAHGLQVRVRVGGVEPSPGTTVGVHRLLHAAPSAGATVGAGDVAAPTPAWDPAHDVVWPGTPDTLVVTPDARFAVGTCGTTLAVVLLADGSLVVQRPGYLNGPAGPAALSADGRTLALGVFPPAGAPELAFVDLTALATATFSVDGYTGRVVPVGPPPALPQAFAVSLGGPAPGRIAFSSSGTRAYVTLSSGLVRVLAMSTPSVAGVLQDIPLGAGVVPFGIAVTPDDARALVTDLANNALIPVDLNPVRVRAALATGTTPLDVVISPDGARAVVPNAGSADAAVFDLVPGAVVVHAPRVVSLGFAPGPAIGLPDRPLGQGAGSRLAVVDGNRVRFLTIDGAGAVALDAALVGPFAQPLVALATAR
jgi:hypothetical protein